MNYMNVMYRVQHERLLMHRIKIEDLKKWKYKKKKKEILFVATLLVCLNASHLFYLYTFVVFFGFTFPSRKIKENIITLYNILYIDYINNQTFNSWENLFLQIISTEVVYISCIYSYDFRCCIYWFVYFLALVVKSRISFLSF